MQYNLADTQTYTHFGAAGYLLVPGQRNFFCQTTQHQIPEENKLSEKKSS
jgi:hypothetical protein